MPSGHYGLFEAIRCKRVRQAVLLAEAGIDLECRDERGRTPLICAVAALGDCDRSRTRLVRLFLEAGADPDAADWSGATALMHAAARGLADTVRLLLECGRTSPSLTDPDGNTALMLAASRGHEEVVAAFVSLFRRDIRSLQLHRRNADGLTALQLAARNRHDACVRLLTHEAQCFPGGPDRFPDPRELDREPTPVAGRPKGVTRGRSTGTMTVEAGAGTGCLSILECSVGDLPANNFTHPFGLQTTKCTQVVSVELQRVDDVPEEPAAESKFSERKNSPRIDEWPAIPLQLKSVPLKAAGPLLPINPPPNAFRRKCLLRENSCNLTGLRVRAREPADGWRHRAGRGLTEDAGPALQKESAIDLLPLIPCGRDTAEPLPPVKYAIRRSGISRKDAAFSGASYVTVRADQTPREIETFKKNVLALS